MGWKPGSHKPSGDGTGGGGDGIPAGIYLLAVVWFVRRPTRAQDGYYLRCRYRVVEGPKKHSQFFSNMSLNTEKPGSADRLYYACLAMKLKGEIDLESEKDLGRAFLDRPFKAEVTAEQNGRYLNNDIRRYISEVDEGEQIAMDRWREDQAEWRDRQSEREDQGDWGDQRDDPGPSGSSSSGGGSPPADEWGDDDVPFVVNTLEVGFDPAFEIRDPWRKARL